MAPQYQSKKYRDRIKQDEVTDTSCLCEKCGLAFKVLVRSVRGGKSYYAPGPCRCKKQALRRGRPCTPSVR